MAYRGGPVSYKKMSRKKAKSSLVFVPARTIPAARSDWLAQSADLAQATATMRKQFSSQEWADMGMAKRQPKGVYVTQAEINKHVKHVAKASGTSYKPIRKSRGKQRRDSKGRFA